MNLQIKKLILISLLAIQPISCWEKPDSSDGQAGYSRLVFPLFSLGQSVIGKNNLFLGSSVLAPFWAQSHDLVCTPGILYGITDPLSIQVFFPVTINCLTEDEKRVITLALEAAVKASGVKITGEVYGKQIEDRGSQITFSALGQSAPADKKYKWDPKHEKRRSILAKIDEHLGGRFEAKIGGTTSIDVTRKGQDKAYGIAMICENLRVTVSDIIFIGDALFEGGNDYEVKKTGVQTVQVGNPNDTASFIKSILSEMA